MLTRRDLLKSASSGVGYLAFAALAHEQVNAEKKTHGPLSPKEPHFLPRAKRVIFLSMRGAPSHVDMFDYKPKLNQDSGNRFYGFSPRTLLISLFCPVWVR